MKTFKEFQTESYSKLDENWLVRMGLGGLGWQGGSRLYDAGTKKSFFSLRFYFSELEFRIMILNLYDLVTASKLRTNP